MKKIYFATTNQWKLNEASEILGIKILGISKEVDEVQSLDCVEVATKKAISYFELVAKPIFTEDVSLTFNALGKLPGPLIDSFYKELGNKGLCDLLKGKNDKTACAQTTICYVDEDKKTHIFVGRVKGNISKKPKGNKGFGWDPIFIPENEVKTFGQMSLSEKNKYSMRAKALSKLKIWLQGS